MAKKKKTTERKPNALVERIKANPRTSIIIVLVILLVARIGLFLAEAAPVTGEPPAPTPVQLQIQINPQPLDSILLPMPEFRESDYWPLASANMFDPKQVLDSQQIVQQAGQQYEQALREFLSYERNKDPAALERARERIRETLERMPNHYDAQQLRDRINALLNVETAPTAEQLAADLATTATAGVAAVPTTGTLPAVVGTPQLPGAATPAAPPAGTPPAP